MLSLLKGFRRRGGIAVFMSGTSGKVLSLLVAILIARWLEPEVYGYISYSVLVISGLIPFAGGGFDTALLRYGAIAGSEDERQSLSKYALTRGIMISSIMLLCIGVLASPICARMPGSLPYFYIIMFMLTGDYLFRCLTTHLRIFKKNEKFALLAFSRAVLLLFIVAFMVPFLHGYGYVLALAFSPFLSVLLFIKHWQGIPSADTKIIATPRKVLWRFAIYIGVGAVLSRMQFFIDGVVVGNMIEGSEALAQYRVASLIPMTLLIVPAMFFNTEYVHITENHGDRAYILGYLKRYWLLALALSVVMIVVSQLLGDWIVPLIFGQKYAASAPLFKMLIFGICGAFILRQPFGNLLNASGRAELNVANAAASVLVTLYLLMLLISEYGLLGAATATALSLWISGLLSTALYFTLVFPNLK
jgi:O-antigen/teichoic acid export membrane protein